MPCTPPKRGKHSRRGTLAILGSLLAFAVLACSSPEPDTKPLEADSTATAPAPNGTPRTPSATDDATGSVRSSASTDSPSAATDSPPTDSTMQVRVFFSRDERPVAVTREVPRSPAPLRAALEALLRGPTAEERAERIFSFFSEETGSMLRGVSIDDDGHAVVDFHDLRRVIPNASTSAGSAILLGELNSTVFQFPTVRSVEYRIERDCQAFGEWLQYGECIFARRP